MSKPGCPDIYPDDKTIEYYYKSILCIMYKTIPGLLEKSGSSSVLVSPFSSFSFLSNIANKINNYLVEKMK